MPDVFEQFDKDRFAEIRRLSVRAAQLWLQLLTAADGGHVDSCKELWKKIRNVSVEVSDLLKAIGVEKQRAADAASRSNGSKDGAGASSPVTQNPENTPERVLSK